VFRITGQGLVDIFRQDGRERHYRVERGLPVDARVLGARYDAVRDVWDVAVESESFDELPEGAEPPVLEATMFIDLRVVVSATTEKA